MKHEERNKKKSILAHHLTYPFFQVLRDKSTKLNDSEIRYPSADQVEELSIKE